MELGLAELAEAVFSLVEPVTACLCCFSLLELDLELGLAELAEAVFSLFEPGTACLVCLSLL